MVSAIRLLTPVLKSDILLPMVKRKLTDDQVADILSREHYHGLHTALAKEFGLSAGNISRIRKGTRYLPKEVTKMTLNDALNETETTELDELYQAITGIVFRAYLDETEPREVLREVLTLVREAVDKE